MGNSPAAMPWGPLPTSMIAITSSLAVSMTETVLSSLSPFLSGMSAGIVGKLGPQQAAHPIASAAVMWNIDRLAFISYVY